MAGIGELARAVAEGNVDPNAIRGLGILDLVTLRGELTIMYLQGRLPGENNAKQKISLKRAHNKITAARGMQTRR